MITLMTGTTIAQAIPVLASPILTRLYSPSEFGIWTLYMTMLNVLGAAATGRYEVTVALPDKEKEAATLLCISILTAALYGIALFFPVIIWGNTILTILNQPQLNYFLYFLPFSITIFGFYQALTFWLNRRKCFTRITQSRIAQSIGAVSVSVTLGLLGFGPDGLIFGIITGQLAALIIPVFWVWSHESSLLKNVRNHDLISLAKRYSDWPKFSAPTAILDNASLNAPILFLSSFFNTAIVGYYSLVQRLMALPTSVIGNAFSQVFLQHLAESHNRRKAMMPLVLKSARKLPLFAVFIVIVVSAFGPAFFGLVFGPDWRVAGEYASIVAPAFAIRFVVSPLSYGITVSGRERMLALWKTIYFCSITTVLLLASSYRIKTFLIIFTIHEIVLYILYFVFILIATHTPQTDKLRDTPEFIEKIK